MLVASSLYRYISDVRISAPSKTPDILSTEWGVRPDEDPKTKNIDILSTCNPLYYTDTNMHVST